jgi:putative ABC transport system ATP-binding protein
VGHTGGFGEPTCVICHIGDVENAYGGSVAILGLPEAYEPGAVYALSVVLRAEETTVAGFQLSARFSERRRRRAHEAGGVETEARRLLAHLGLEEPDLLRRKVTHLSVGQQQRVAAARALLGSPELVIADEPTSSLDPDRRASFLELLFRECAERRATLLFVSHDPSLAAPFDRVLDLRELQPVGVPA